MKKILLLLVIATSCNIKPSLSFDKMKVMMWEIMNANSSNGTMNLADKFSDDELAGYKEIFDKNKVTEQDFYQSFHYYQSDPQLFKNLIDSAITYGEKLRDKLNAPKLLKQVK